jgi:hypothetical protein
MSAGSIDEVNRYKIAFPGPELKFLIRKYATFGLNQTASYFTYIAGPLLPRTFVHLDRPVFVVGCSRSGTTIFVDMFRQHRSIAEWSEAGGVFEPRYFDPQIDHCKDESDATEFAARRIRVLFGLFTKLQNKQRFLNKHPQNSLRIPFIRAIFPEAQFIHLIREGCATSYSNYLQVKRDKYRQSIPFGSFPKPRAWRELLHLPLLLQFGYQWRDIVTHIRHQVQELPMHHNYLEIRYEDFCQFPHQILSKCDEFCGLERRDRDYGRVPKGFESKNDAWKKKVTRDEESALKLICDPLNFELGYQT